MVKPYTMTEAEKTAAEYEFQQTAERIRGELRRRGVYVAQDFSVTAEQAQAVKVDRTLLDLVADITSGERRRDYGRPLTNHLRIAIDWTLFLQPIIGDATITPDKVVWMMVGLKKARETNTPKFDNLLDAAGYETCLDDMYLQLVELGHAANRDEAMSVMTKLSVGAMYELLKEAERADKNG